MALKQKADKSFQRFAPDAKGVFGQHVIDEFVANTALLPSPPYTTNAMKATNNLLISSAAAARSGDHTAIAARNAAEASWNDMFGRIADYVSLLAQGNAVLITQAGFTPTAADTTASVKPNAAVLDKMTQQDGGVAKISMVKPGAGKVAAHLSVVSSADATILSAADGTITVTMASGEKVFIKVDTHSVTTIGGLPTGKMLKVVVQPVNNKGAGPTSAPKTFMPQP